MLDLLKLKTFLAVAATNSFTRAAAELGYSQSSVTTHIQALERELGAPLFDRVARNIVLTEAGRGTLEYAKRLLALADEAKAAVHMHADWSGQLSVGAQESLVTYRLPEVLRHFQALYPHVQLRLESGSVSPSLIDAVLAGTLDLAVIVDEMVRSDRLATSCLGREEILIVRAPDYPFAAAAECSLPDIAAARVLLTGKDCTFRIIFERALSAARVSLRDPLDLGSIEAAKQCAIAGLGLGVLPKMAVDAELDQKRLVSLPWPGPAFPVHIQMIRLQHGTASPALYALWSLVEQSFESESMHGRS